MPEFPEVYEQVSYLRERCRGFHVARAGLLPRGKPLAAATPAARRRSTQQLMAAGSIEDIYQRGKLVIIALERGTLITHLMYRGRWSVAGDPFIGSYKHFAKPPTAATQSLWLESDTAQRLAFHSVQNLEWVRFEPARASAELPQLRELGPELMRTAVTLPGAAIWSLASFTRKAAASKLPIGEFLLDQSKVAGLGRRYVPAALAHAEISARRRASSLSPAELRQIMRSARTVARPSKRRRSVNA